MEDEEEEAVEEVVQSEGKWVRSDIFQPLPPAPVPEIIEDFEMIAPLDRVTRYIGNDFFRILTEFTNQRYFKEFGMKIFWGQLSLCPI